MLFGARRGMLAMTVIISEIMCLEREMLPKASKMGPTSARHALMQD
jgi:hypothetical protein